MRNSWIESGTATPTPAVILMIACAEQLYRFIVEEESLISVEAGSCDSRTV